MESIDSLAVRFRSAIERAEDGGSLEKIRLEAFGRKGKFTELAKRLAAMPAADRPAFGREMNRAKTALETSLKAKIAAVADAELEEKLKREKADVTLPLKPQAVGRLHPITVALEEVVDIFAYMGFAVADGPQIEDDFHNFSGLNIPPDHPARQMHDTIYLDKRHLLRTHTSPVQVRYLKRYGPPIRIIAPGRVYRHDNDQTHTPMFHQVEGLAVDRELHMGHLKGCLEQFIRRFFSNRVKTRLRPSYFPFTEPSAEVDALLEVGGKKTWVEILGCGMVHENVLRKCGVEAKKWQGFAFGLGVERLVMLKNHITDLRPFFANQKPWLEYYGSAAERL